MSIELPVRPSTAAVEQAAGMLEDGVAKAGASLGAVAERISELDIDDGLREVTSRLRDEADEIFHDFEMPSQRDQLLLGTATIIVIAVLAIASVLLIRGRRTSATRAARRKARRRRA